MAIRIITVDSKGIAVSASTPSYVAKPSFADEGLKIIADGFGYSAAVELTAQQVNPVLYDIVSFSESIEHTWVYQKLYTDTVAVSDLQEFNVNKVVAETIGLAEITSNATSKVAADTFSLLEELSFTRIVFLTFEDVVVFSEDFNNTGEEQQWVNFSEIQEMLLTKNLAETLTFSDTTSTLVAKAFEENLSISDIASVGTGRPAAETVSISTDGAVSLQDYFASDYIVSSGDQPYISSYQSSI